MRHEAHVVIIGSGITGLSCAYWLSKFGVEDVVVIDRHKEIAQGSTKKYAGIITQNFSDKTMVQLAIESMKLFRNIPCNLVHNGQVFLYGDMEKIEDAKKTLSMQKEMHLAVEELDRPNIFDYLPAAFLDDINYGLLYKGDGLSNIKRMVEFFKDESDVEFILDTTVKHIYSKDDKITEISTNKGKIKTSIVINAAGAHAGVIGHFAGVNIPVVPMRMHCVTTTPVEKLSRALPCVNDTRYGLVTVPYNEGFYLLQKYHHDEPGFYTGVEENFIYDMLDDAEKRFPSFTSARVKDKFSLYHAVTPDSKPIIGETGLKGFYCACGFGGNSLTFAPVAGMIIADLIVHNKPRHDISGLGVERFVKRHLHIEKFNNKQ